jgi:hypothetical protein
MWRADLETVSAGRGHRIALRHEGVAATYAEVVAWWRESQPFRAFFTTLLADAPYPAFFFETPPVTATSAGRAFEFVLADSPALAALAPDPTAFADRFAPGQTVAAFANLSGDALLVAPAPQGPPDAYAHLAAFARRAPALQHHDLWQAVGGAVAQRLSAAPLWLSTSGLGVPWLHVRLDTRPKYYTYGPYRRDRGAPSPHRP